MKRNRPHGGFCGITGKSPSAPFNFTGKGHTWGPEQLTLSGLDPNGRQRSKELLRSALLTLSPAVIHVSGLKLSTVYTWFTSH